MTYDIYRKALQILKDREEYHGRQAHREGISYTVATDHISAASAYYSAYWILYYAIHEDWESLDQYDYVKEEQE